VLLLGVAPRAVAAGAYGVVAWSFVVEFAASLVNAPSWLLDLSLLHHVALAPAVDPNWTGAAVMVAMAMTGVVVGALTFRRRDIVPS
jgi:ABC-2 type transport system permease protein